MLKIKLLNIASEFSRIKEESQKISREGLQKSAVRMVSDLKSVTPVDTGNARDSWSAVTTPVSVDIQNTAEYMKYLLRKFNLIYPEFIDSGFYFGVLYGNCR